MDPYSGMHSEASISTNLVVHGSFVLENKVSRSARRRPYGAPFVSKFQSARVSKLQSARAPELRSSTAAGRGFNRARLARLAHLCTCARGRRAKWRLDQPARPQRAVRHRMCIGTFLSSLRMRTISLQLQKKGITLLRLNVCVLLFGSGLCLGLFRALFGNCFLLAFFLGSCLPTHLYY